MNVLSRCSLFSDPVTLLYMYNGVIVDNPGGFFVGSASVLRQVSERCSRHSPIELFVATTASYVETKSIASGQ